MKKHLIIGGSRGIGASIINQLPTEDMVITINRNPSSLTRQNLEEFNLDVLSDDLPDLEGLSSIVYCPGSINLKPINSLKEEDFLTDYRVNVLGAVRVIQHYFRDLKRNSGSIVLFSTVAAKIGMPFHASVAAAKSGVEGLAKSLAAEFSPNIRVNCIAPTITNTDLAGHLLRNEKAQEATAERHPLKRYLQPEEVAAMAVFLLGPNSAGMTGQVIGMDAGIGSIKS